MILLPIHPVSHRVRDGPATPPLFKARSELRASGPEPSQLTTTSLH